jgi:FKBP-type peptidyl-prolyl cis-trans isomerase FkpA
MRTFITVVALAALSAAAAGCTKPVEEQSSNFKPTEAPPEPPGPKTLEIVDEVVGTGREAKTGDKVKVHYTGTLMGGKKFDSSRDRPEPFAFTLGKGEVIKGWDQGVVGMKVGGKRKLTIPSDLGYGPNGSPPKIPGNAGLKFDVELVGIE